MKKWHIRIYPDPIVYKILNPGDEITIEQIENDEKEKCEQILEDIKYYIQDVAEFYISCDGLTDNCEFRGFGKGGGYEK